MADSCALSCSKFDKTARCIDLAKNDFEGRKGLKTIKLVHTKSGNSFGRTNGAVKESNYKCTVA